MRVEVFFWILLSWVLGLALASLALPTPRSRRLRLALAAPLGMGIVSLLEFVALTTGWVALTLISELLLVVAISLLLFRRMRTHRGASPEACDPEHCPRYLTLSLLALAAIAFASFILRSYQAPHGESDAMNIWNLHARFLFRDPEHWHAMFSPTLDYSHPDYPLLLPGFIASTWARLGSDTTLVPTVVALGFSASLVALLYESLRDRGLGLAACLATFALLAGQGFTQYASAQLADVPLAFFYLASAVLLTRDGIPGRSDVPRLLLAGFCAGLAAWTKNEGQLFLLLYLACGIVWLRHAHRARPWRSWLALVSGAAPALVAILFFKIRLATGNDLISGANSTGIIDKLLDGSRYLECATGLFWGLVRLGDGFLLIVIAFVILSPRQSRPADRPARLLFTVLASSTILGYCFVYIALSGGIEEHMATSLSRLLLQVWPLTLFAILTLNPLLPSRKVEAT